MKSYKLQSTDMVYWTVDRFGIKRIFADTYTKMDVPAVHIDDYGDLIKTRTIKSELLRIMYDTQE